MQALPKFSEFLVEDDKADTLKVADVAAKKFEHDLKQVFPESDGWHVSANLGNLVGPTVRIFFWNKSGARNGIADNAATLVRTFVSLSDKFGNFNPGTSEYEISEPRMSYKAKTIKFRKLKGKTVSEVLEKLLGWFKKNKTEFERLADE